MFRGAAVAIKELDVSADDAGHQLVASGRSGAFSPSGSMERGLSTGSNADSKGNVSSRAVSNGSSPDSDAASAQKLLDDFKQEVAVLRSLRSSRLVQFVGACTKPPNLMIVTEYLPNGSLFHFLKRAYSAVNSKKGTGRANGSADPDTQPAKKSLSLFQRLTGSKSGGTKGSRSKSSSAHAKQDSKPRVVEDLSDVKRSRDADVNDDLSERKTASDHRKVKDNSNSDSDASDTGSAEDASSGDDEPSLESPAKSNGDRPSKEPLLINSVKHRLCLEVAYGLSFLHEHSPPIVHRDLKSRNVLLDEFWNAKICDFGLSRTMTHTAVSTGTPSFIRLLRYHYVVWSQ